MPARAPLGLLLVCLTGCGIDLVQPTVTITPANPTTVDDLQVELGGVMDDEDVSYTITWTVDGDAYDSTDGVPAASTGKGQTWTASVVVATDKESLEPVTASVTIANTAPTASGARITPADPTTITVLTCEADGTADIDEDVVSTSISWSIGGVEIGTGDSLQPTQTQKGDAVVCTLTPNDGEVDGTAVEASTTILNTPPGPPTVEVRPERTTAGAGPLVCTVTGEAFDVDGDVSTYTMSWQADGLDYPASFGAAVGPSTTTHPDDTVPADDTALAEAWSCSVVANDGEADSPAATASATVIAGCETLTIAYPPGWGSRMSDGNLAWSNIVANQAAYGDCEISFVEVAAGFTLSDLVNTGAEVVLLGNIGGGTQTYSAAEREAVTAFVEDGHGGVVLTYAVSYMESGWSGFAPLAGVDDSVVGTTSDASTTTYTVRAPDHPLMTGLGTSTFDTGGFPNAQTFTSPLADNLLSDSLIVADASLGAVVARDNEGQRGVWVTTMVEFSNTTDDGRQLLYNSLVWAGGYAP